VFNELQKDSTSVYRLDPIDFGMVTALTWRKEVSFLSITFQEGEWQSKEKWRNWEMQFLHQMSCLMIAAISFFILPYWYGIVWRVSSFCV